MTEEKKMLFSQDALKKLLWPLIIEQFLAIAMGMADTVMAASCGEAVVSGISLVDSICVLLIGLFTAMASGGAVVAAQYMGHGDKEMVGRASNQLFIAVGGVALLFMTIALIWNKGLLALLYGNVEADVMNAARIYFYIVAVSFPFLGIYNGGAALFRAVGDSKVSMKVSLVANLVNIAGNAILIYGFHRGTEGVAIPTLVSRMTAAIIIIALLCDEKRTLHIERTWRYRINWEMVKKILSIGVPNGLENSMFQLGKIIVLSLVSTFGTYAIAANAVSNAIALFQILPGMAITLAITPVISRCVGAGDYEQAKYYNKKLMLITYVSMTAMVLFIFSLLPFILNAYNLSDLTAKTTADIIHFHGIGAIFIWPVAFSLPATFRAAGDAKACMYISSISMWIFRIGFSYVLGKYMGMGVFGIWVAMVIDWVFRAMCFVIRYFKGSWKKNAIV